MALKHTENTPNPFMICGENNACLPVEVSHVIEILISGVRLLL